MKILAIGGSGGMGRFAVNAAQHFDHVEQIVVADLNAESAHSFAAQMNDKVSAMRLDASDVGALQNAMAGIDMVVNTCGPFFRFGAPILQAAIDAQCHYLDICDDWEPTVEMLGLNQAAKAAGVCATVGLGASPGVSNLLTLIAMQELDSVATAYTGWDIGGAKPEEQSSQQGTNAAMLHGIEQMTGRVKIYREGAFEMTKPLAPVPVSYPGLPSFMGYIFGHPEAITFPHNYPQLQESINLAHGGGIDSWQLRAIVNLVDWGILSRARAASLLTWVERNSEVGGQEKGSDEPPVMYGLAIGTKNEQPASVGVSFMSTATEQTEDSAIGMGAITGVPLACGIKFLAEGRMREPGVFSPEAGHIEPREFLSEVLVQLGEFSGLAATGFSDHVSISRSW